MVCSKFEGDCPTHTVTQHVGLRNGQAPKEIGDGLSEARYGVVVACRRVLLAFAEAGQVDREDPKLVGQAARQWCKGTSRSQHPGQRDDGWPPLVVTLGAPFGASQAHTGR